MTKSLCKQAYSKRTYTSTNLYSTLTKLLRQVNISCATIRKSNRLTILENVLNDIDKIKDFLVGLGITLHPKKCYLQDMYKGVKFVGAVILPNRIYVANRTKGNFWQSLKDFHNYFLEKDGNVTLNDVKKFINSTNSYLGFLKHYKTYNIRKKLLISSLCKPWLEYLTIDSNYLKVSLKKEMSTAASNIGRHLF